MKPELEKIMHDIDRVEYMMSIAGDGNMCEELKMQLSDLLAYACYEIRRRYDLTSLYWCVSEDKAAHRYKDEYGE